VLKIFFFLTFIIHTYSESFPILIKNDWKGKTGRHLEFKDDNSWENFSELTIKSDQFNTKFDSKTIEFTLYKKISIPKEQIANLNESLSMLIPFLSNAYEIYFNGEKISSKGKIENDKMIEHGFTRNIIAKLKNSNLKEENEIFIYVSGLSGEEVAVYGDKDTLIDFHENNIHRVSERVSLMLLFLYSFVGFYHLLLFAKRKQEKYNFFFGMFCVCLAIYIYTRSTSVYELGLNPMLITRIEYIVLFHVSAFALAFFEIFLREKLSVIGKGIFIFTEILSIPMLFVGRPIAGHILQAWQISALVVLFYSAYLMAKSILRKHQDSKRLSFGFLVLLVFGIWDIIGATGLFPKIKNYGLLGYGFFIFVIGIAFVLANRFLRVHDEVEELNENLEKKVEDRTKELQKSLTEVRELKLQQDGDYFLTSLLIKPLMINQAKSSKVKIDFYIKQKKSFEFKNKTYQIGGDMCIANNIRLRGKNYCVFINGDAMGKSIQGAGGALVLGVVFRSIIERTKIFKPNMELFPEQWIKICFIELQNVFVSFDGSMLVSIVMGLIEEENGAMYFLNAEHPWTVLYRDKKASFLEDQLYLHKVGMLGLEGNLKVNVVQMQNDDSIIIGSDGRDDIMLGMDSDGQRNINEDGEKFLKHVEDGNGELEGVTKAILKTGEFTDDYTLIKIQFQDPKEIPIIPEEYYNYISNGNSYFQNNDYISAFSEYTKAFDISKSQESYQKLTNILYQEKKYSEFVKLSKEYLERFPIDNEEYFRISYAYKFLSEFSIAADYGECLRLRDSLHLNNLLNLADIYRKQKNYNRAAKLLNECLMINPENSKAIDLQNKLIQENK
jgi:tetratricopeptide (TPR) repeat protein